MAVRVGDCRQCGQCCQRLGWLLVHADEDTLEWMRVRDPDILIEPDEVLGYHWISLPYPCKQLVSNADGTQHCGLHDRKPAACQRYPEPTDELKPGCGYGFAGEELPGG